MTKIFGLFLMFFLVSCQANIQTMIPVFQEADFLEEKVSEESIPEINEPPRYGQDVLNNYLVEVKSLKENRCIELQINQNDTCVLGAGEEIISCIGNKDLLFPAQCSKRNITHVPVPKDVKSVYYNIGAASSESKREHLFKLAESYEINSVTIDIKNVSGYVAFEMPEEYFGDIKPVSNNVITDIEDFIEELHERGIYVIGRVVVFKDKYLAQSRPDLALKWGDKKTVWYDYKGNKYLDAASQEVWDYNINMASAAYDMGFDEINFDYVRFPTDGNLSNIYYPFSQKYIDESYRWGKVHVIDRFAYYMTSKLKEKHPDLMLSADVFGLVTNSNGLRIGQTLESFVMNFDFVGPMIYPSHYSSGFLGFSQPDNRPYEIFTYSMSGALEKIEKLNKDIEIAQLTSTGVLKIQDTYVPARPLDEIKPSHLGQVRPWLQGFSCTRCKGAWPYNRDKFRKQIEGINKFGYDSWWVWSSGSNYYPEWYDPKEFEIVDVENE